MESRSKKSCLAQQLTSPKVAVVVFLWCSDPVAWTSLSLHGNENNPIQSISSSVIIQY